MPAAIKVEFIPRLHGSEAMPLAVEAWHALLSAGHISPLTALYWDDAALLARQDGRPVGIFTLRVPDEEPHVDVRLGYVVPAARGRGVLAALGQALRNLARERGRRRIEFAVMTANAPMLRLAAALGARPTTTAFALDLAPAAPQQPQREAA